MDDLANMSGLEIIVYFAVNICLTAAIYLLVPTMLALLGKKFDAKTIHKIVAINNGLLWLGFRVFEIAQGNDVSSGASVFLWGWIGDKILRRKCLLPPNTEGNIQSIPDKGASSQPAGKTSSSDAAKPSLSDVGQEHKQYGSWNVRNRYSAQNNDPGPLTDGVQDSTSVISEPPRTYGTFVAPASAIQYEASSENSEITVCQKCKNDIPAKSKFCQYCGYAQPQQQKQILFCRECGNKLAAGYAYCNMCGTKVSRESNK